MTADRIRTRATVLALLIAGLACIAAPAAADAAAPATAEQPANRANLLDALNWLAGSWAGDTLGVQSEEHWMAPRAGMMVGMHRDVRPGRRPQFEFLRIVADTGGVAYLANPGARSPATRFPAVEIGERRVVFANPAHDYPQRILYWLDDAGSLHARVEGTIGGELRVEQWRWRTATLD